MQGYISEIRLFAADFAPKYWAFCSGQLLAVSTNQALFSLLGTTYGGNGIQTFALPDFRGRAPMGTGQAPSVPSYPLGLVSGSPTITALLANLPGHTHVGSGSYAMGALSDGGDVGIPTGNNLASLTDLYSAQTANTALRPATSTITIGITGSNAPIPVQQPYLGMNYVICLYGQFPSRN